MNRDVQRSISEGRTKVQLYGGRYDMTAPELDYFRQKISNGAEGQLDAIIEAFLFGVSTGTRIQRHTGRAKINF